LISLPDWAIFPMLAERGRIDPRANRYNFLAEATLPKTIKAKKAPRCLGLQRGFPFTDWRYGLRRVRSARLAQEADNAGSSDFSAPIHCLVSFPVVGSILISRDAAPSELHPFSIARFNAAAACAL